MAQQIKQHKYLIKEIKAYTIKSNSYSHRGSTEGSNSRQEGTSSKEQAKGWPSQLVSQHLNGFATNNEGITVMHPNPFDGFFPKHPSL